MSQYVEPVTVFRVTDPSGVVMHLGHLGDTITKVKQVLSRLDPSEHLQLNDETGASLIFTPDQAEDLLDQLEELL
jgi:hypothetical protein